MSQSEANESHLDVLSAEESKCNENFASGSNAHESTIDERLEGRPVTIDERLEDLKKYCVEDISTPYRPYVQVSEDISSNHETLRNWFLGSDPTDRRKLALVTGEKFVGKTVLLGSMCDQDKSAVAGSFFFSTVSGYPKRCSKASLVPTIAYQIAVNPSFSKLGRKILEVWEKRSEDLLQSDLQTQVRELLLEPSSALQEEDRREWPRVIVIDGLDHIRARDGTGTFDEDQNDQHEVLGALSAACAEEKFPFRVLISSRSSDGFSEHSEPEFSHSFPLGGYDAVPELIRSIRATLPESQVATDSQAEAASHPQLPSFSSLVRYIREQEKASVKDLLNQPTVDRDAIYKWILKDDPEAVKCLWAVHDAQAGLHPFSQEMVYSSGFMREFLGSDGGKFDKLGCFSTTSSDGSKPFTFYDTSVFEFLKDKSQDLGLYFGRKERHAFYMETYLRHWKRTGERGHKWNWNQTLASIKLDISPLSPEQYQQLKEFLLESRLTWGESDFHNLPADP
ncbi:hypothetical protein EST38_g8538 [Candolleomyces aberdarensis]|uniref:Nephrocystin 3-like N-terminal domain-containing protein n=1 Tax=Candolleomyces aberdarensis TaxID=2316362 RepID=A0A4Q2DCZ7_9AGAR|nr:hypothetical protein EST38_g8538 [Candolleomyces aberdarensis]